MFGRMVEETNRQGNVRVSMALASKMCAKKSGDGHRYDGSIPSKGMVPFWMDTFYVPRGSDPRVSELRSRAGLMMAETYRCADVVLVLDSALENAADMSVSEFGMRLKFCGWSRVGNIKDDN